MKKLLRKAAGLSAAILLFAGCSNVLGTGAESEISKAGISRSVATQTCDEEINVVKTLSADASDGSWYFTYKESTGLYHVTGARKSGTNGGSFKFPITEGRYLVEMFMRFTDADTSSGLSFDAMSYRKDSAASTIYIQKIEVLSDDGKTTNKSLTPSTTTLQNLKFTSITTNSIGSESGWIKFSLQVPGGAVADDALYLDNIAYNKNDGFKISTTSSATWSQTGKFQFIINESIAAGQKVSFKYKPCANATKITVRGATSSTKWISDAAISGADSNGWYSVEATATQAESGVGVTFYVSSTSTSQYVQIKDFTVNGAVKKTLSASEWYGSPSVINCTGSTGSNNNNGSSENQNPSDGIDSRLKTKSSLTSGTISGINLLTAGPGENSSNEVIVSFHSSMPYCQLEYTGANGSSYSNKKVVQGTASKLNWYEGKQYYRYQVKLSGLTADSAYKYRVGYWNGSSLTYTSARSFRTAGTNGSFSFLLLSDLHTPKVKGSVVSNLKTLKDTAKEMTSNNLDFTFFNGDMVNKGQRYDHWMYWNNACLLTDGLTAWNVGNHEYYGSDDSKRNTNDYYVDCVPFPKNHSSSINETNYWFIYNKVLFIVIDSMESESNESVRGSNSQKTEWFKSVVSQNAGKFDYLVACNHYPFVKHESGGDVLSEYTKWYKTFDECKVDFALSSDSHVYYRSKPLYNGKVVADSTSSKTEGTVYVTTPMTQGEGINGEPTLNKGDSYLAYYSGGFAGGIIFDVTSTKMTMRLFTNSTKDWDKVTVYKRSR